MQSLRPRSSAGLVMQFARRRDPRWVHSEHPVQCVYMFFCGSKIRSNFKACPPNAEQKQMERVGRRKGMPNYYLAPCLSLIFHLVQCTPYGLEVLPPELNAEDSHQNYICTSLYGNVQPNYVSVIRWLYSVKRK